MANDKDDLFTALALDIITEWAVSGDYTNINSTPPDLDTRTDSRIKTGPLTITPVSPPVKYTSADVDGTNIKTGDMKIFIAGVTWEKFFNTAVPQVGDLYTFAGTTWNVRKPNPIYSGDKVAVYAIQLRKGIDYNAQ